MPMTRKMEWAKLLNACRYSSGITAPTPESSASAFREDAARILYSTPFRRLQGKTQVHPLPRFDYLRTRLTHTIEVAHVGRMIATECARKLIDMEQRDIDPIVFGDIVYSACLAHDVGNPPFGHIGEYAIQTWFEKKLSENFPVLIDTLKDDNFRNDFLHFDGNAQGFRILTRLSGWRTSGGLQLTYATLGAFSKYPYASKLSTKKKFGYMHEDSEAARKTFSSLGLILDHGKYCRHPLAFIVEAADDICYLTTDIEDACRLKLVNFPAAETLLRIIAETGGHIPKYNELSTASPEDRIAYLRAGAVSSLADAAVKCFSENINPILEARFTEPLVARSKYKNNVEDIRSECNKTIYKSEAKLSVEAAGFNMIMQLMDLFGSMIEQFIVKKGASDLDMRSDGLFYLLPLELRECLQPADPYASFLVLVDFVSGMTDRYVLDIYQRLTGTSVSLGRML
jgi:dGTPase